MSEFAMEQSLILVLLTFLIVSVVGIIYLRNLLAAVILLGLYSLTSAVIFVVMDAVDVAFTEAAVGAGISTILLLSAMSSTTNVQKPLKHGNSAAKVFVVLTGALLIYGTLDMPHYGAADSPAQQHPELARHFIEKSGDETGVPNIVTSVLASYRGYDTLGETVVVFTAGIAVLSLLGRRLRRPVSQPVAEVNGDAGDSSDSDRDVS